jgi:hypothetical protein
VLLEWETAVEIDNYGFLLLRSASGILDDAEVIAFVPAEGHGHGGGAYYSFVDDSVSPRVTCTFWLVDVDTSGRRTLHSPVAVTALPDADLPYRIFLPIVSR